MRPLVPAGSAVGNAAAFAGDAAADFPGAAFTALAGLAALETVADFAVFFVEGKFKF